MKYGLNSRISVAGLLLKPQKATAESLTFCRFLGFGGAEVGETAKGNAQIMKKELSLWGGGIIVERNGLKTRLIV